MSWLTALAKCCEPNSANGAMLSNAQASIERRPRPRDIPQSTFIKNHTTETSVGVGLIFESTRPGDSGLVVSSVPTGGPAFDSGQIDLGDELVSVNDNNVENLDPERIAPYILGPPGSEVKLGFRTRYGKSKEVVLKRRYAMKVQTPRPVQ